MVKFVELESGNLLNMSSIQEISPHVRIKNNSERIKVIASVHIIGADGCVRELISGAGEVPWPNEDADSKHDAEIYETLCRERKKLEEFTCSFFADIVHKMCLDLKICYQSPGIQKQLQLAAQDAAERIAKAAQKMEGYQNE